MTAKTATTAPGPRFCVCRHGIGVHDLRGCRARECRCTGYTAKPEITPAPRLEV